MKKYLYYLFPIIVFSSCTKQEEDFFDFNKSKFNTIVEGNGSILGYEKNINNKLYICPNFRFVYWGSVEDFNILVPQDYLFTDNKKVSVFWQNVDRPYKLIKEPNADSLIIIKDRRTFVFKKEKVERPSEISLSDFFSPKNKK